MISSATNFSSMFCASIISGSESGSSGSVFILFSVFLSGSAASVSVGEDLFFDVSPGNFLHSSSFLSGGLVSGFSCSGFLGSGPVFSEPVFFLGFKASVGNISNLLITTLQGSWCRPSNKPFKFG